MCAVQGGTSTLEAPHAHYLAVWICRCFHQVTRSDSQFLHSIKKVSPGLVNPVNRVKEINSSSEEIFKAARRPKTLKKDIRAAILLRLSQGQSKYSLCEDFGITISTVNKLMRSEPSVANAWKEKTISNEKFKRRSIWENTVKTFSNDSATQIRCRLPAVYVWLYRNDREWLTSRLRELPNGRIGNHSAVDWSKRDQHLLEALKSTADYLLKSHELPLKKSKFIWRFQDWSALCKKTSLRANPIFSPRDHRVSSKRQWEYFIWRQH